MIADGEEEQVRDAARELQGPAGRPAGRPCRALATELRLPCHLLLIQRLPREMPSPQEDRAPH
jgi:hypothetical protein